MICDFLITGNQTVQSENLLPNRVIVLHLYQALHDYHKSVIRCFAVSQLLQDKIVGDCKSQFKKNKCMVRQSFI